MPALTAALLKNSLRLGFVASIHPGSGQERAGKERRAEGMGRTGVIWKENRALLMSAVFQAVGSISHSVGAAEINTVHCLCLGQVMPQHLLCLPSSKNIKEHKLRKPASIHSYLPIQLQITRLIWLSL